MRVYFNRTFGLGFAISCKRIAASDDGSKAVWVRDVKAYLGNVLICFTITLGDAGCDLVNEVTP